MRTATRSTRRTTAAQLSVDKENLANHGPTADHHQHESSVLTTTTSGNRKPRHRVSTAELARLEDVFGRDTHPSRQQKKDLAAELGMDYKTITIWFQNKRQTSKRGQSLALVERSVKPLGRTACPDASCLRSVSSPSRNATLGASEESRIDPAPNTEALEREVEVPAPTSAPSSNPRPTEDVIASQAIVKIRPLFDSLNALASRSRERSETTQVKEEVVPNAWEGIIDSHSHRAQTTALENAITLTKVHRRHQTTERDSEQSRERAVRWKRIRTLEWACERQAKRRRLLREGFVRHESEEPSDDDPNDARMESAVSLLSLASSTQMGPPEDVMRGVALLLSFKHSWRRK